MGGKTTAAHEKALAARLFPQLSKKDDKSRLFLVTGYLMNKLLC